MGYELLIRPRPGEPAPSEAALRAFLDRAQREGLASAPAPQTPAQAAPGQAPGEAPPSHAAAPGEASEAPPAPAAPPQPTEAAPEAFGSDGQLPGGVLIPAPALAGAPSIAWTLANGRASLRARLYRGEAGLLGADLEVPFGGAEEELRSAVDFALLGAQELGATVFDPQLLREVSRESTEDIVQRWRLSQQWAVDVAGSAEDTRSTMALTPAPPLLQRRHKIALGILGLLVLLYEALGLLVDAAH